MLLYCNIWKMFFYNPGALCSFSFYLNAGELMRFYPLLIAFYLIKIEHYLQEL